MGECLFCKIIAGEIPCRKIYEDEGVFAFLDIAGDADGHTLVVPKAHCRNVLDAPGTVLSDTLGGVQRIARHFVADCGLEGVNIINFSAAPAGQTVFHLHFHIYPRKTGDGYTLARKLKNAKSSLEEMQKLLQF
jgi:histidine triad (HIT) family protein